MSYNSTNVSINKQELNILIKSLSKAIEQSVTRRFVVLSMFLVFFIGIISTLVIVNVMNTTPQMLTRLEVLLKRANDKLDILQEIKIKADSLTTDVNALFEKIQEKHEPGIIPQPQEGSSGPVPSGETDQRKEQCNLELNKYKIYIHYANRNNKNLINELSQFLEAVGFKVVDIERVKYKNRDIRYFHANDKEAALLLKKLVQEYVSSHKKCTKINLKIKDLGRRYPRAQIGLLELWFYV